MKHNHRFKATDIPGVSLCKCGIEIYYASGLQAYYVSVGGIMSELMSCANCGDRVSEVKYYRPYFYCSKCYREGLF
jgi:hypothetical protein